MVISDASPRVAGVYSGTRYVLQITLSVLQTNKSGPSIQMWRSDITASWPSALRTACLTQSCVCGCVFVSNSDKRFNLSLMKGDIPVTRHAPCYNLEGVSSLRLGLLYYFSFIPIQPRLQLPPSPTNTHTHTHTQAQQIQEICCAFVVSRNRCLVMN
jgi:hypothetical protein